MESLQEEKIRELNVDLENLQNKLDVFEEASLDDKEARRESVYELLEENSKLNSELNKVRNVSFPCFYMNVDILEVRQNLL